MKYTLLEMTQRILGSIGGDEVDSYADTVESTDVSNIIKETYWYLVSRMDLPAHHTFFKLDASGDSTKPTLMTLPSDVLDVDYIKYSELSGTDVIHEEVKFMELEDFMQMQLALKESETTVETMTISLDGTDFTFKFKNDNPPRWYTTTEDTNLMFDSYDSAVDSTLQSSKTLCYGKKIPTFTMSDSFIPKLDAQQFQLLLNEAKSQASIELKHIQNAHSDMRARKTFINTQRTKNNVPSSTPGIYKAPRYGRK